MTYAKFIQDLPGLQNLPWVTEFQEDINLINTTPTFSPNGNPITTSEEAKSILRCKLVKQYNTPIIELMRDYKKAHIATLLNISRRELP